MSDHPQERNQRKAHFIEWLRTPPGERDPRTMEEYAERYPDVHWRTLYKWRKDPRVLALIRKRNLAVLSDEFTHDLLEATKTSSLLKGREGDKAREHLFKILGYLRDGSDTKIEITNNSATVHMTDRELVRRATGEMVALMVEEFGIDPDEAQRAVERRYQKMLAPPDAPDLSRIGAVDADYEVIGGEVEEESEAPPPAYLPKYAEIPGMTEGEQRMLRWLLRDEERRIIRDADGHWWTSGGERASKQVGWSVLRKRLVEEVAGRKGGGKEYGITEVAAKRLRAAYGGDVPDGDVEEEDGD